MKATDFSFAVQVALKQTWNAWVIENRLKISDLLEMQDVLGTNAASVAVAVLYEEAFERMARAATRTIDDIFSDRQVH